MTNDKYKAIIEASGGFTRRAKRAGDRPQPLTAADEAALSEAWETVSETVESTSASLPEKSEPIQEKRTA